MAKFICEFDTNDKTLKVLQGSDMMTDIYRVEFYCVGKNKDGSHEYAVSVDIRKQDVENDMVHVNQIYATKKKEYEDQKCIEKLHKLIENAGK